jgi:hypothetical protein
MPRVYLDGAAVATRKHPAALDIAPQVAESRHLALVHRAEELHSEATSGLSPRASRLSVKKHIVQLRNSRHGGYVILVWIWLSDGTRSRCAWLMGKDDSRLCRTWERVAWTDLVFKERKQRPA